jgi:hypothetical protein
MLRSDTVYPELSGCEGPGSENRSCRHAAFGGVAKSRCWILNIRCWCASAAKSQRDNGAAVGHNCRSRRYSGLSWASIHTSMGWKFAAIQRAHRVRNGGFCYRFAGCCLIRMVFDSNGISVRRLVPYVSNLRSLLSVQLCKHLAERDHSPVLHPDLPLSHASTHWNMFSSNKDGPTISQLAPGLTRWLLLL